MKHERLDKPEIDRLSYRIPQEIIDIRGERSPQKINMASIQGKGD